MTKVLLLTDSVALPRLKPEFCSFEDTWPHLLQNEGILVHQVSIGGGTSSDLLRQSFYHKAFNPDIVIVQVGIVDCAPRFMRKLELDLVRQIPLFGNAIIKNMNRKPVKKLRNISYVNATNFQKNLSSINAHFSNAKVHFIEIIPATSQYEKELPGITARIKRYNSIIKQFANIIPMEDFNTAGLMSDHHHLNKRGHLQMYEKISSYLNA